MAIYFNDSIKEGITLYNLNEELCLLVKEKTDVKYAINTFIGNNCLIRNTVIADNGFSIGYYLRASSPERYGGTTSGLTLGWTW